MYLIIYLFIYLNFLRSRAKRRRVALLFWDDVGDLRLVVLLWALRQNARFVPLATLHPWTFLQRLGAFTLFPLQRLSPLATIFIPYS